MLVQCSNSADVKARSSFGVAPSFKKRDFQAKQSREQSARAGSQYFRPEISVPPTRCSSNEIVIVGRSSAPYSKNTLLSYFVK